MNDKELFKLAKELIIKSNQPYGLNYSNVENMFFKIQAWQKNPANDCLRSRGDSRWVISCELAGKLQSILESSF
jgi:hypothetical protein